MEFEMNNGHQHETEPVVIEVFTLLDMDRMLLDSDTKIRIQCKLLTEFGVSKAEADAALATVIASKGSAYPESTLLEGLFGAEMMETVHVRMVELAQTDEMFRRAILYGGASQRLIAALRTNGYPMGIFTNGVEKNQQLKIEILRAALDETEESLPAIVTAEGEKAIHVGTWVDEQTGLIAIPPELTNGVPTLAHHMVVIDDKLNNVVADDAHGFIRGIHVDNHRPASSGLQTTEEVAERLESGESILQASKHHVRH